MTKKASTIIKDLAEQLLTKLEIEGQVDVRQNQDGFMVYINSIDPGILIGAHGQTLEAIQTLLGQMVYKQLGQWQRLTVDTGDYLIRRKERLTQLAQQAIDQVAADRQQVVLSDLSPAERREIHLLLRDHPQVVTESEGVGRNRVLLVKPKS